MKAIKGAALFDGVSDEMIKNPVVLLEGDRITEVGTAATVQIPADAEVLDYGDCFLMPGMLDIHVHLTSEGSPDPRKSLHDPEAALAFKAARHAQLTLAAGFTTVRSMGAKFDIDIQLKKSIAAGFAKGPRITASGRCITITGGHGHNGGIEADGPWEVRKAVRTLLKSGADVIKVMATGGVLTEGVEPGAPELCLEELQAAAVEAANAGKRTATHAQGNTGIRQAVEAGINSIEHGCFLDDEVIALMLEKGTALVPTLAAPRHILDHGLEGGIPQYAVDKTKFIAEKHLVSFAKAYKAGVPIGLGTDAGTPFNYHGANALELQYMVEAGMSIMDALRAATSTAAAIIGQEDNVGSLRPGCYADVLAVKDDPTQDVQVLAAKENIAAVILGGEVI